MKIFEFVNKQENLLQDFMSYWIENWNKDPKQYPLNFDDDNTGMWHEQFEIFCNMTKEDRNS